jgi:hypothetical protein
LFYLFTSCNDNNKEIKFKIDKYEYASESDFICSSAFIEWWYNDDIYVVEDSDIVFNFVINKNNLFIQNLEQYGYYDLEFIFQLSDISEELRVGLAGPRIKSNKIYYPLGLEFSKNKDINRFKNIKNIKNKNVKVKALKNIMESCKIYAINPKGERMNIKFTKETMFYVILMNDNGNVSD